MREFRRKCLSSALAILMLCGIFVGSIPLTAYAQQTDAAGQPYTEEEGIATASVGAELAEETAVITAPGKLALDGSKSYVIFTSCVWGAHTYAIGPDAAATANLGVDKNQRGEGSAVYLAQKGLGWTLTQEGQDLFLENGGKYLTVSADKTTLAVSGTKTASGLAINSDGTLSLAGAMTETVYLHLSDSAPEPQQGQAFGITDGSQVSVFYFGEIQKDVIFPSLLPQEGFHARIVSPDHVYGDDQYVLLTEKDGKYVALNSGAECSAPLTMSKAPAVGVELSSADRNVLWTVNNNRDNPAPAEEGGYYKYIRSCASNKYLTAGNPLLSDNIRCEFYLAGKDDASALIATADGKYVALDGDGFGLTAARDSAARFYFAKLLQANEQQAAGGVAEIPDGTLMRLVDWNTIENGKTYVILNATEFNKLHYALSGNGRLARYGADNLTQNDLCPNPKLNGVYGETPCEAKVGDIFYTNGQDILWTASDSGANRVVFQNVNTNLYLKPSDGPAASQTASISNVPAAITIEQVDGKPYAYLSDGLDTYLGIWQYVCVGVSETATERCAYYLAEVLSSDLPATQVEQDDDPNTVSFGGIYSVYQGSQHLLTGGAGVESFIMMPDSSDSFKPSSSAYSADGKNDFYVTYCADYAHGMPTFTEPGKYEMVSLDAYNKFDEGQKAALAAIIPNCYPYVTEEAFLDSMKEAGFAVSANCGSDEIMAGIQAAIYTITNPQDDEWGYESSDGWAHNSYEVNKSDSYVSNAEQAKTDVNNVRDYLLKLASPEAMQTAEGTDDGFTTVEDDREYFAITTEIGEGEEKETWALSFNGYGSAYLAPYNAEDIRQLWYQDAYGLHWFPGTIYKDEYGYTDNYNFFVNLDVYTYDRNQLFREQNALMPNIYSGYHVELHEYSRSVWNEEDRTYIYHYLTLPRGCVPVKLEDGYLKIHDSENKLANCGYTGETKYPDHLHITNTGSTLHINYYLESTYTEPELKFEKKAVTPRYPNFVEYNVEDENWNITYNEDNTYNAEISGSLNFPVREDYDHIGAILYFNNEQVGFVEVQGGKQDFNVKVENIPNTDEAHFWVVIQEEYVGLNVFVPGNAGWQVQIGAVYNQAYREIHESTTSIPVKKIWTDKDSADHSKDDVEVCLVEDGEETAYKLTLNEGNNWQGSFAHVPYERWTYYLYGPYVEACGLHVKIPLEARQYDIKETNVKSGYTPSYDLFIGNTPDAPQPTVLEKPQKEYPVQVSYTTEAGEELVLSIFNNPLP